MRLGLGNIVVECVSVDVQDNDVIAIDTVGNVITICADIDLEEYGVDGEIRSSLLVDGYFNFSNLDCTFTVTFETREHHVYRVFTLSAC